MAHGPLHGVVQVRVARPTAALAPLEAFYRERVGLAPVASFAGHAGFDGAILAASPGGAQFELTQGPAHSHPPAAHAAWQLRWRRELEQLRDPDGHLCGRPDASSRSAGDVVFTRATARLESVTRFYAEILGLVARDGDVAVEFPLPAGQGVLRLIGDDGVTAAPTVEDIVVFYFVNAAARAACLAGRVDASPTLRTHNPWWHDRAVCTADPDGFGFAFALAGG
jgi:hypothetical protein